MPFTHTGTAKRRRLVIMLAVSIIFLSVALFSAFKTPDLILRFGLFFISGILMMGVWLRGRKLLNLTPDRCRFDQEAIEWQHGGEGERLDWREVSRCMLITGNGVAIRLKTNDGTTRQISPDCFPGDTGELLAVLTTEVMPACGWIRFSVDNEILRERGKAEGE